MSRLQQDADTQNKTRTRANTTSFPSFAWPGRRPRLDPPSVVPAVSAQQEQLSLDSLIQSLTPPAVPSLTHARALASALSTQSPLPRRAVLNPVLASLCDVNSPVTLQAAGYDILSAYWENNEATTLATADRLSYFSLFLGSKLSWGMEIWEPRFKALRALTRYGIDVVGIEIRVLGILKSWIEGGFEGLLNNDVTLERTERAERERSIDILAKFLATVLNKVETVARIPEEELSHVLHFYAALVDRSIRTNPPFHDRSFLPSSDSTSSNNNTPSRTPSHGRTRSSISASSIPSTSSVSPPKISTKHPADVAISLYLDHLSSQLKTLSPDYLNTILPLLFRALAFYSSPLPRLTVLRYPTKKASSEDEIVETLNALFTGPYSTTCMLILKKHLFPPAIPNYTNTTARNPEAVANVQISHYIANAIQTTLGAHRTFRNYVRRALSSRLARAYIETSIGYSPSGAPGYLDLERDLMERAWPKEDYTSSALGLGGNGWDAGRLGKILTKSVEAWVEWQCIIDGEMYLETGRPGKEDVLEEAAGVLKDIWQELDARSEDENGDGGGLNEEEACVVGETLYKLVGYVLPLRNQDGTPFILPVSHPPAAPSPFLRSLSSLLSRDHSTPTNPPLSTILIYIADHLTDADTANLPRVLGEQHGLSPTSPDWLDNWYSLMNRTLVSVHRPITRCGIMEALKNIYESVRDMQLYRRPLADMVYEFCMRGVGEEGVEGEGDTLWRILGHEVVLRNVEYESEEHNAEDNSISRYIDLIVAAASEPEVEPEEDNGDTASFATVDTRSPSPSTFTAQSTIVSPIMPRTQSEHHTQAKEKEKESGLPSVMSILSSLTTGTPSRSHSTQPLLAQGEVPSEPLLPPERSLLPRVVAAVSSLIAIFTQLAFTPFALEAKNLAFAVRIFEILLGIAASGGSTRARLTALQFLMHLRAHCDHRLYFTHDTESHVMMLSALINRTRSSSPRHGGEAEDCYLEDIVSELRKARPRVPQENDGRQPSRGRGTVVLSHSTTSRSRSRATSHALPSTPTSGPLTPFWCVPENFPFPIADVGPNECLLSYADDPTHCHVLPVSSYLSAITDILERENKWEILSYVLCHLPVQLANKHLFCGPKSREVISKMLSVLCAGVLSGELGFYVDRWPHGLKARDAQGLAYHTLSVLVSYRRCFDLKQCHLLVEVFQTGLNGQLSTIQCCLHALSLSAFELQSSMTKFLPRILEMLSQIMSNPNMAVHILGFLSIIGSLPPLYANFTEDDFKMVFGVALQYLQHYTRLDASPTTSWALSQHVRILSYTVVYVWFLAVKLQDRPNHISYITRQLLLANEGKERVDDPTEVCFDWLARYTYASADPRPAHSVFSDIVMNPHSQRSTQDVLSEKTWVRGHSIITVRAVSRRGWIDVLCRRPSGFTRFLCRAENAPMVHPGDVDPDLISVPASLVLERNPLKVQPTNQEGAVESSPPEDHENDIRGIFDADNEGDSDTPRPDPITGYVWSGTAPSQRRKEVIVDPSYFALQLSAYPEPDMGMFQVIADPSAMSKFFSTLDRIPVIDTHKVGIMYVAPGQSEESDILRNTFGSPAYTRFLEGLGRLINLRGQVDVYAGGLDPDDDGEYAYAWWNDIGQILYHTATMMPFNPDDPQCNNKKRHIGNDYVRIVWNDSGNPYRFDTLATQFQFVNIVIEPHSFGAISAFSNNDHESEYFKVTVQRALGMTEFAPIGHFKIISAENLPLFVRQLSLLADWFASVFSYTDNDTVRVEMKTNWHTRLEAIRRFKNQMLAAKNPEPVDSVTAEEASRDFTRMF